MCERQIGPGPMGFGLHFRSRSTTSSTASSTDRATNETMKRNDGTMSGKVRRRFAIGRRELKVRLDRSSMTERTKSAPIGRRLVIGAEGGRRRRRRRRRLDAVERQRIGCTRSGNKVNQIAGKSLYRLAESKSRTDCSRGQTPTDKKEDFLTRLIESWPKDETKKGLSTCTDSYAIESIKCVQLAV